MTEDPELEALRQKRMQEVQAQQANQAAQEEKAQQFENQKQSILRQILTPEARGRLANIKLANPEQANMIEMQLIQIAQSGRLQSVITDAMLRDILQKITPQQREIKIERR
ncbi:DNA-binding protein [Candidatus Methanoplasma termitum]|uniref:DNA-binding protein Mpt1_c04760 n=1 Tax=Candidatus Methanoplasma termitum TaxID=1577791 RepID=A0A0A7LBH1_9ARCH|nr:DNA-binding protein [Candidatus Methanoplasma termitum]AIZ56368.1 DNA-binding protein [Candidatus Methanoplasma termitum]MCL2333487.1 DNA-binding protein [Candidatus Methanoplasma sp.]